MLYILVLLVMSGFSFYIGSIYGAQIAQEKSIKVFNVFYSLLCKEFGEEPIKTQALNLAKMYEELGQQKQDNN